MKVMERFGREAARRSSMAAADGLSGRRERMSDKRRRGEERSVEDEDEDCKVEVEDNMVLSQMTSSARRRHHTVVRGAKQDHTLKVIGVQVPRKARSASAKRSYENSSSANDGVVKDQNLQKQNVETRKKMKQIGSKNRPPKSPKLSSGSVEEDIENEIAEVLFGLMKQSQSSKDGDSVKSSKEDEYKDRYSIRNDSKTSISEHDNSHSSDPELKNVSKENSSIAEAVEVESKQQPKKEASLPNWEPESEGASESMELQEEEVKPFVEESIGEEVPQLESKREDKFEFDLMAPPPVEDSASDNVAEAVLETLQEKNMEVINEKLNESRNQDDGTNLQQQPKTINPKLDWRTVLSATTLQPGSSPLSQPCAKRCATHHYIARNIYLHQNGTKMNNLWPRAAGSGLICDTKPDIVIRNEIPGSVSGHSAKESKDESSEATFIGPSKSKKLVAQQSPSQPASAGNIMHGSTIKLSVENQASVAATSKTSGPSKYTEPANNASHFSHSALSKVAAATVSSPNVTFQEGPYLAINGYSFPMTTPSGTTLAFQGGNFNQAVPIYNGPFYSNQIFHPSQLHQQQPLSQFQHQVRSNHQKNTGMSTDSSSSRRQPAESQQLQKTQLISMQSQRPQKKYVTQSLQPCKLENDINGTSSQAQGSVYGYAQNFAVPLQPMNFTMMPYVTLSGGGSGNHIEQSQQQEFKGVFGMSFGSISGNKGTGTLLNFSSMPQNPAMYQNLPTTQGAHQKNHQVSERKTESVSENPDHDGSKAVTGRSSSAAPQTLVFDKSAINLNFTTSNAHQQRLYQFQLQQQQFASSKAPKSAHVFSQALVQCNTPVQSPNNSVRSLTSQVPITTSTVNSFLQQQGRTSQGQTQISFGGNPKSSLAVQQGQLTNPSLLTT